MKTRLWLAYYAGQCVTELDWAALDELRCLATQAGIFDSATAGYETPYKDERFDYEAHSSEDAALWLAYWSGSLYKMTNGSRYEVMELAFESGAIWAIDAAICPAEPVYRRRTMALKLTESGEALVQSLMEIGDLRPVTVPRPKRKFWEPRTWWPVCR